MQTFAECQKDLVEHDKNTANMVSWPNMDIMPALAIDQWFCTELLIYCLTEIFTVCFLLFGKFYDDITQKIIEMMEFSKELMHLMMCNS